MRKQTSDLALAPKAAANSAVVRRVNVSPTYRPGVNACRVSVERQLRSNIPVERTGHHEHASASSRLARRSPRRWAG
jgi:hypothetical protein